MRQRKNHIVRNAIAGFGFGLYAGNFAVFFFNNSRWNKIAPREPDAVQGLVFPHTEHGGTFYYSAEQALASSMIFWPVPLFLLAIIIMPKQESPKSLGMRFKGEDPLNIATWTSFLTIAVVIAVAYFFGHDILNYLLAKGFGPRPTEMPTP